MSNLNEEEKRELSGSYRCYRASNKETSVIHSTAHSKIVGGKTCDTETVMDSGCSFLIMSTAVADGIGAEVKPLTSKLEIIDESGKIMDILGTIRMYINNRVLGGRKLVEAAVGCR